MNKQLLRIITGGGKYAKETLKYFLRSRVFIGKYVKEIERLYAMTPEELRERNSRKFVELFQTAYDRSPFYRKLYMEAGIGRDDIRGIDDIGRLPIVTKDMLRHNTDQIRIKPKWQLIPNFTSGTTGMPLKVWESWPAIWREQAYFYCYRKRCGFTYGQPLASLRGDLGKGEPAMKVHASNTLFLSCYDINEKTIQTYYEQISSHKPVAIEGFSSTLYSLALLMRDKGLELHIPVAFTSSETVLDYQREMIEKQFHTKLYDHYGTTERTISLNENFDHIGYFEEPGYSINEFVEDGEITTGLINYAFPLIRYKGTDIMEMEDGRVKKVGGRKDDVIICKDGSRVTRIAFVETARNVKACQWVQSEPGKLELRIVPDKGFIPENAHYIEECTYNRVGRHNIDLTTTITTMEGLIYTRRGKFKLIVNINDHNKKQDEH